MGQKFFAAPSPLQLDSVGAAVSIACAIQCSVFPLLIGVLPLLGLGFLLDPQIESIFLVAAAVLGISSFAAGFRAHRRLYIFLFLAGALVLIFGGRKLVDESLELPMVVTGSLVLATGHFVNWRLCHRCTECDLHRQDERDDASDRNQS
jgi:hypothetical protein